MQIILLFLASFVAFAAALNKAPQSLHHGHRIPEDWKRLSQAAGLAQQPYCSNQHKNQTVGDAHLLYEYGDGDFVQRTVIFKSKSLGIVVAFEGTDASKFFSLVHDLDAKQVEPHRLFGSAFPPGTKLFKGFQSAYVGVASHVLQKVKELTKEHKEQRVTLTGHSLGGAMALLAAAHFEHELKQGIYRAYSFGLPRTGNPTFANAIDYKLKGKFYYAVNGKDCVPHMSSRENDFQHPSGQIWINGANSSLWTFYPGQENVHGADSVGKNCTMFDHKGSYFHTNLGPNPGLCPAIVGSQMH